MEIESDRKVETPRAATFHQAGAAGVPRYALLKRSCEAEERTSSHLVVTVTVPSPSETSGPTTRLMSPKVLKCSSSSKKAPEVTAPI